jgi:aldehyde:ferredoxin oxidoreductase
MPLKDVGLEDMGDPFNPDDVVTLLIRTKGGKPFEDSMGTCTFVTRVNVRTMADMLSAVTGWDYTFEEAMETGERISNLMRVFNLRHGISADVDLEGPSERYGSTPVDGPVAGVSIANHWQDMVHNYYEQSGWDRETGKPLPDKLRALGLEEVVGHIWEVEPAR